MKVKFKVINGIPRLLIRYRSLTTNGQLTWNYFPIPTRPSNILNFLKKKLYEDLTFYRDELGIVLSHDEIYKKEDIILAVGIGNGISLIHNCKKPRFNNTFIGIEGSREQLEIAKANAKLNGIDLFKFQLIEGYAGNPNNIYGEHNQYSSKMIDINQFKFDVLELDCEGSEIEILSSLKIKPRHIIVEMHPMYRDVNIDDFLDNIKKKGYSLGKIYTVNGELIQNSEINNYFTSEFIQMMLDQKVNYGDGLLVLNFTII